MGTSFEYIDIGAIDQGEKAILRAGLISCAEAPSRARQLVQGGDVLVSTVRPNLNAVAFVTPAFNGATASTGFTVLRPNPSLLDSRYLFFWVRSPQFVAEMTMNATGASYPAVSDAIVKRSVIPSPPLPEQRRIAAILDKANAIRRQRRQSLELTQDLLRSAFLDMFGDPVVNSNGHRWRQLRDVCLKITDGEHLNPALVSSGVPLVMAGDLSDAGVSFDAGKFVSEADAARFRGKCAPELSDVLLVGRGATIGRSTLVDKSEPFCLMGSVILLKCDKSLVLPDYLVSLLREPSYRKKLFSTSGSSAQQAIYLKDVAALPIPLPALRQQQLFCEIALATRRRMAILKDAQEAGEALFQSLSQRAFAGELTTTAGA